MSNLISQNLNMIFKTPKGETVHALKDVNFTLKKGELLTVLGPSGCGKTTLLNITAGFLRPTSGLITLNGNEINGPGVERGMVFQQGALFEWLTVSENVDFGLRMKKEDPVKTAKKVEEWLNIVGLQGFGDTPTYQLYVMAPRPGRIHKEYNLPFASMGIDGDLREIKKTADFVSKREEILTMIWDMEEEIMGKDI
jgi:ABC-type taurine transport system ATPase subunit